MKENFNKKAFEILENTYESRMLLDAIGNLDNIRSKIEGPDQMRNDLQHLHTRAMNLLNHGDRNIPGNEDPIYFLADDIKDSIYECMDEFEKILKIIKPIIQLSPETKDDDIEEDDTGNNEELDD